MNPLARALWTGTLLGSFSIVVDTEARAVTKTDVVPTDSEDLRSTAVPAFSSAVPAGIHRRPDGRYVQEVCGTGFRVHCQSVRLLPDDYVPPPASASVVAATSFCGTGGGGFGGAKPASAMAPKDVLAAYHLPASASAGGKIVALIDMPDSSAFTDLNAYRTGYGLPALPKCTSIPNGTPAAPCFAAVDEKGTTLNPTVTDCPNGDGETGLDLDMVSAACPDCSILLVQMTASPAAGPTNDDFLNAVATATRLGAVATSISFGGPEATDPLVGSATAAHDPTGWTTPGNTVFVAAGDFGYDNQTLSKAQGGPAKSPSYPASAPDVIAVGGTNLASANGAYTEKVWNDGRGGQDATTSGCSTEFTAVPWQSSVLAGTGCAMRATADLAAAAAFTSNGKSAAIAAYASGSWSQVEGTSASSPMVAAIFTRLGLAASLSTDLGWPYRSASGFTDVTVGDDDNSNSSCGKMCSAGAGWDGPTGVGTPNGAILVTLPPPSGTSTPPVDAGAPPGVPPVTDAGSTGTDSGAAIDSGGLPDAGSTTSADAGTRGDEDAATTGGSTLNDAAPPTLHGAPDAGTSSAGSADNSDDPSGTSASGCGCKVVAGHGSSSGGFAALGLALAGVVAARRRRK